MRNIKIPDKRYFVAAWQADDESPVSGWIHSAFGPLRKADGYIGRCGATDAGL
jgi:hypothetical protein